MCVFSFPFTYSCLFLLLFLSLSLCYFLVFFLLYPICYSSPFWCLTWVYNSLYLKACFILFSPLFSPPKVYFLSRLWKCIFYQGSEPETPCIYAQVSLTHMQHLFLHSVPSLDVSFIHYCQSPWYFFLSSCSAEFIIAFFLYLFKLLAGKIAAVW